MKQEINGVCYFYQWLAPYDAAKETVVCLHGFTGSSGTFSSFSAAKYNYLVIDLIGHGKSDSFVHPYRYQQLSLIRDLKEVLRLSRIEEYYLLGYSMGARTALAWGMEAPEGIKGLLLESGSPGIQGAKNRALRQRADRKKAQRLLQRPLTEFVDEWEAQSLFYTQKKLPDPVKNQIRAEREAQVPFGLAMSLLYMGTGAQKNYWQQLASVQIPVLYIAGALDEKFCAIGQKMAEKNERITYQEIADAGHCVHLEKPAAFQAAMDQWLEG